jgi:hypothetical protein
LPSTTPFAVLTRSAAEAVTPDAAKRRNAAAKITFPNVISIRTSPRVSL